MTSLKWWTLLLVVALSGGVGALGCGDDDSSSDGDSDSDTDTDSDTDSDSDTDTDSDTDSDTDTDTDTDTNSDDTLCSDICALGHPADCPDMEGWDDTYCMTTCTMTEDVLSEECFPLWAEMTLCMFATPEADWTCDEDDEPEYLGSDCAEEVTAYTDCV